MSITIVKAKNGVDFITPSKNQKNPEKPWGYFRVEEVSDTFTASGLQVTNTKSMLFSGEIANLEKSLAKMKFQMQGSLFIDEISESDLDSRPDLKGRLNIKPEMKSIAIAEYTANEVAEYEQAVAKFIKRAGADGPELLINGNRILRFTSYDPTGVKQDSLLQHTNVEEVTAFRLAERTRTATLPN